MGAREPEAHRASDAAQLLAEIVPKMPAATRGELMRLLSHTLAAPSPAEIRERRIGLLVELVSSGEAPGVDKYERERRRRGDAGEVWPAHSVLIDHYGRWSRAVSAAVAIWLRGGLARVISSPTRMRWRRSYTREEATEALRRCQRKVGGLLTKPEYEEFRRVERMIAIQTGGADPRLPGPNQIRTLFGGYARALEVANRAS